MVALGQLVAHMSANKRMQSSAVKEDCHLVTAWSSHASSDLDACQVCRDSCMPRRVTASLLMSLTFLPDPGPAMSYKYILLAKQQLVLLAMALTFVPVHV